MAKIRLSKAQIGPRLLKNPKEEFQRPNRKLEMAGPTNLAIGIGKRASIEPTTKATEKGGIITSSKPPATAAVPSTYGIMPVKPVSQMATFLRKG